MVQVTVVPTISPVSNCNPAIIRLFATAVFIPTCQFNSYPANPAAVSK